MGGVKQAFRHVEALVDAGWDAHILVPDMRTQSWFDSRAPVARIRDHWLPSWLQRPSYKRNAIDWLGSPKSPKVFLNGGATSRRFDSNDVIVFPEFYGKQLIRCGFGSKLVVFNQNAHYTFGFSTYADELPDLVSSEKLLGVMSVSDHVRDYLTYAFPSLQVLMTPNGVDPRRFFPTREKKRQIAFMPRKLPSTIVQVLQILKSRGKLQGWELCPIDGVGEDEVARRLRDSAIFMSTCHDEGFGLPPLEAGACGCVVVGFCGQAAREFMRPEFCFPVDQGDVLQFAQTLERVMAQYEQDPSGLLDQSARYAEFIHKNYSLEREQNAAVEAWKSLCGPDSQRRR